MINNVTTERQISPKFIFLVLLNLILVGFLTFGVIASGLAENNNEVPISDNYLSIATLEDLGGAEMMRTASLEGGDLSDTSTPNTRIFYNRNDEILSAALSKWDGSQYVGVENDLFIKDDGGFGADDTSVSEDANYKYLFTSQNEISFDGSFYVTYSGENKVKLNVDDICKIIYEDKTTTRPLDMFLTENEYLSFFDPEDLPDAEIINNTECNELPSGQFYYSTDNSSCQNNTMCITSVTSETLEPIYSTYCKKNETYKVTIDYTETIKEKVFDPNCQYTLVSPNQLEVSFTARYNPDINGIKIDPFFDADCDSGDRSTVCYINTPYTSSNGEDINGTGALVIQSGGSIINTNVLQSVILNWSNITIQSGGNITGANITIMTTNLTIDAGGYIFAAKLGQEGGIYDYNGNGTGKGKFYSGYSSGAGHGGRGGQQAYNLEILQGAVYDSSLNPVDFGSGGAGTYNSYTRADGGNGGGIVRIVLSDTLDLNGQINTDAGNGGQGASTSWTGSGGSGGTINIDVRSFTGSGNLTSKGGNAGTSGTSYNGNGGGGIIAVYYNSSTFIGMNKSSVAAGSIGTAFPYMQGTPGTFILVNKITDEAIIKDGFSFQNLVGSANESGQPNRSFWNTDNPGYYNFTNLTIYGGAKLSVFNSTQRIDVQNFTVTNSSGVAFTYIGILSTLFVNITSTNLNENLTNVDFYSYGYLNISLPFSIRILNHSDIRTFDTNAKINIMNKFNSSLDMISSIYGSATNQTYISFGIDDNVVNLILDNSTIYAGYLNISLTNLSLNRNSSLNTDNGGYTGGYGNDNILALGPGHAHNVGSACGAGAGHSGIGGAAYTATGNGIAYDSALNPIYFGSGGAGAAGSGCYGWGGNGGGVINLRVSDTLSSNGTITSNGENGDVLSACNVQWHGGGGSGGSINIVTKTIEGAGNFSATGGKGGTATNGCGASGAGGIVAIYYNSSTYTGLVNSSVANGNVPYTYGFFQLGSPGSLIFVDQVNNYITTTSGFRVLGRSSIANESTNTTFWNTANPINWNVNNFSILGYTRIYQTTNMTLNTSALILSNNNWECSGYGIRLNLTLNNLTIDSTSSINLTGCGYGPHTGPGLGTDTGDSATGSSYGGEGGAGYYGSFSNKVYGSTLYPTDYGTGGTGTLSTNAATGAGGGTVQIYTSDTLNLTGSIKVNGVDEYVSDAYRNAGGTGGSILINTKTLTGSGALSANGSRAGYCSGGGSGGRIAVYYNSSTFTGLNNVDAMGGSAYSAACWNLQENGKNGTIVFINKVDNSVIMKQSFRFQLLSGDNANESWAPNQSFWNSNTPNYWNFTNVTLYGHVKLIYSNSSKFIYVNNFSLSNPTGGFSIMPYSNPGDSLLNITSTNLNENLTNIHIYGYNGLNVSFPFAIRTLNLSIISSNGTGSGSGSAGSRSIGSVPRMLGGFNSKIDLVNSIYGSRNNLSYVGFGGNDNSAETIFLKSSIISGGYINLTLKNLSVDSSSLLYSTALGYPLGTGPGVGINGGGPSATGSSHGGQGGKGYSNFYSSNPIYGSSLNPLTFGSGGWDGLTVGPYGDVGHGGGVVVLYISDTLDLNSTIAANGVIGTFASRDGGGTGGSILIRVKNIIGTGSASAIGAAGGQCSGGSGGGRIAIYYNTSTLTGLLSSNVNNGLRTTCGGSDTDGEPGTFITVDENDNTAMINIGFTFEGLTGVANETRNPNSSFWRSDQPMIYNFTNLTILNLTKLRTLGNVEIIFTDNLSITNARWNSTTRNVTISYRGNYTKISYVGLVPSIGFNISQANVSYRHFTAIFNLTGTYPALYPNLNKSATVEFYNMSSFRNATGLRDGSSCPLAICSIFMNTTNSVYSMNVTGFSNYSIGEAPSGPNIAWLQALTADIDTSNLFGAPWSVNYSIEATIWPLDIKMINIYHKTTDGSNDNWNYVNGSYQYAGYVNTTYTRSNISNNWTFRLTDNMVYPGAYNLDEAIMASVTKATQQLTTSNTYLATELLNISNSSEYNMLEIMMNSTDIIRVYYCNSTFNWTNSNPSTASYCTLVGTLPAAQPYNHTHGTANSRHQLIPMAVNLTTGMTGNVKVTSTSWFIVRGNAGIPNAVKVDAIANRARVGAVRTSTTSGSIWVNQTYTTDLHLHQYNGSQTFSYFACANDTAPGTAAETCSEVKTDLLQHAGMAPQVTITEPLSQYYDRYVPMNYSALSPNGYNISNYTLNLYNATTLVLMQQLNFSSSPLYHSYYWDASNNTAGEYVIGVQACDLLGQCAFSYSENFSVSYGNITLIAPANNTLLDRQLNITLNVTFTGSPNSTWNVSFYDATTDLAGVLLGTVYSLQNGAYATYEWLGLTAGTVYKWFVIIINGAGAHNSSVWQFTPNDEPKVINMRIENITGSCAIFRWDNEPNMDWVSFKVGNDILELRSITSVADNWTTCDLYPNQEYVFEFQTGDSFHTVGDYHNFSFRTLGWNPIMSNYSYRRLITINHSLIAATVDNQAFNLTLNDTNFQYYDSDNYVYYPSFLHLNYTTLKDIRFMDYYDVVPLDFNITYVNIPGDGGLSYQTAPTSHYVEGNVSDEANMYDEDWSTFGTPNFEARYYYNYTIPAGAKTTSLFRLYAGEWLWDTELESDCWGGTDLAFMAQMNYTNASIATYCMNMTDPSKSWIGVHYSWAPFTPFASKYFYETMMTWQYDTRLNINVVPEYFRYLDQINTPGISNNYSVQLWMYYGNPNETVYGGSTPTMAGISQNVFILGDETEPVLGAPTISNLANGTLVPVGPAPTGTNISWDVDQIVDNRLEIATNPFIIGSYFIWRIVNTTTPTSEHLIGNAEHTILLDTSPSEFINITNVSCSNASYVNNFTVNITANPVTITFLNVETTEYLDWNVTFTENKSWVRNSGSPEFQLEGLVTDTQYWVRANAYGDTGNDTDILSFILGTLPTTPSIVITNYTEDRPTSRVIICANLTDMNGALTVDVSFQYFNGTATDFSTTAADTVANVGEVCKIINVNFGENMTYRAKADGGLNGVGYSDPYYDLFNLPYEFFVGNPSKDPTNDLPRQYCPPKADGTANTAAQCYEQQGYREGSQQLETFMYIETNITGVSGTTLTAHLINGSTEQTFNLVQGTYFNYTTISGLQSGQWYTLYITDGSAVVVLNLTKPGMIHLNNYNRTDTSKYISFGGSGVTVNSTYFYMKNPGVYNSSAYQWCQNAPGGNIYDCMSVQYWGGGREAGVDPSLSGTQYDRGQFFRGGIPNGELRDTGILEYTRNASVEVLGDQRFCFAFTVYFINESIIPTNNVTNYYYRYWTEVEHYSDYMGYDQPSTFHQSNLFKWQYDEVALTRDWRSITGTNTTKQLSVLSTPKSTFQSTYNQSLKVGYVEGFSVNLSGDDIYQSGLYLDGQWINQRIGKYQQGFVIYNLPDNATLAGMDSDSDGLNDKNELFENYTNPYSYDTDEDGMWDGDEIRLKYDPNIYNNHTAPNITLTSPQNNSHHNNYINLSANISAVSGIYNITLYINGIINNSQIFSYFINNTQYGNYLNFSQGTYNFSYFVVDNTGLNYTSELRFFEFHLIIPNVSMVLPVNNTVTNISDVNFSANVTDYDVGVLNMSVYVFNNATGALVASGNYSTPTEPISALIGIVLTLTDGVYKWFLEAFDAAGNMFRSGNYTLTVDTIIPNITIITPNNSVYNNGTIWVNISYNDTNFYNVWYTLNGTTRTYTAPFQINLSDGNYTIIAYGNDTAGNINSTQFNFLVDHTNITYCKNLTRENITYTLQTDILGVSPTCFRITANGVTFDGNGYRVSGLSSLGTSAIISNQTYGINITGFKSLDNFYNGITLFDVNNSYIGRNSIYANVYGISITRSHNITIYNNTVYQQSNTGIYLNASVNSTLSSNLITGSNLVGMKIYGNSSYNRIFNNSILSSASDGIDIYSDSSYNIIDDNALTSNTGNGIYIYERSENNTFNNNTMVQNGGLTASPNFNIKIGPSIKNNYFVNQWFFVVNGKAIMDNSSNSGTAQNYLIYNNSMGKIEWTNTSFVQNLSIRTTLIVPTVIRTGFNYAFANASAITLSRINSSAKVTLYNTPSLGMSEPVVLVDGQRCYDCYNFTDLLAPTVVFNVSHWSNYSLGESNSTPSVVFVRPTLNESSNPQWFTSGIFTRWNYTIINVTATDPTLQNITIYLFNSTHDLVNFTNSTTSPLYIQFYNLVEGMYFFNATACNGFDNCNSTETRNITVDLTKPNATDLLPIASPPEVYLNYSNVNISVNMSDAVGIEGATLYLYNSTGWPLGEEQNVTTTYTNAIGVLEAIFGVMNTLADDIYHWFFVVWDLAGNTNVTETRNFTVDTTFPYFIVHNPVNGTYDNGTVLLNITVNDTNVYKISYDYNGTSMTYTVPVYMYTSDGDWNVTITAIDMAGNTNSTQINFSVDNINLTYCKNLTRAGKVYTLMANLTGQSGICFDIRNDNITLNGSNNYISGDGVPTGSDDAGIYSNGYKNLTVENFNGVSDFDIGITLYSVNNSIIRNVNMSSNVFRFGLYLLQNTEGNQIYNNIMDSNEIGMRILNGNNYIIYGNIFRSNTLTEGLRLTGNNNTFNNNTVNDNNNNGLYLSTFNNGIISNNMIYGNGVSTDSNAIWVDNSNNNIFISNIISSNADTGIEFSSSSGNILLNNTIIDNTLYSILDSSGIGSANYLVYNNTFGEIKWINDSFLDNLTLFGNLSFNASLNLSFNFASVSPSQFSIGNINSSANITFYGTPSTGFPYPKILRDGRVCSECYKFTALTDPTVIFNVSSWSNYSLGEDPVHPINCSVLDQENTTYFLEADILRHDGSCFLITANNVTLNGQGHIVNGIGNSNQYAIYALNVWNVTIFNFTNISSWGTGIKINATLDAAIRDTNLSSNLFDIYLTNVLRSNFENITLSGSTNGLYLNGSVENNSFINIDFISHSEYSIYDNASLRNSLSYSNSNGTIFFTSDVFLTNLTFRGNLSAPYQINMSTNNILLNTSGIRDSYMNSSLNISFYVTSIIPFANPRINRNGIACVDCYKLTSFYHVPDVIINTTSDGRYQIVDADNVPPVINFTYPTPITTQLINTSYISINVSAVDSYLMNVTVFLYNANHIFINASTGSTNPYYILLTNGTGLVSGKYYINATACDTSDLCNSTETREIYIDTIIPNVTLISPVNNTISTNLTYNFTVNITDNILSSGGFTGLCYQESANVSTSCGGLDTGIYNIFGIWVDPYYIIDGSWGTSNGYTIWNNQYIDINYRKPNNTTGANWTIAGGNTTSPVIINAIYNVTIPSDCWAYSTTTLSLRLVGMNNFEQYFKCFNSTDWKTIYFINETSRAFYEEAIWWKYDLVNISGIANASLYIYNSSGLYNQTNMTYTQGTAQAILGIPVTLVDGFYYWFYRVIDFALNIRQSETWNLTVDSHKPTISLVPPTNITGTYTNTSTIYVNISSSDLTLQNVTIRFYNSAHALYAWHTWNNSASLNYTFVTPSVVDAIYYYNASSCDQSGNCSYSETRNITIDTITPTIDYVTPPTEIDGSVIAYNSILINLTSTDLNTKNITVRIYNSTHDLVIMNTSNNTFASYFAYNNSLPYGFYYYNATSCDAAYNCNNTATRNITLSICPLGMPGDGSIATPCQITSWLTLNATKQNPSLNYILMNNLSSADTGYIGIGSNWTTVGLTYSATFNGNNKNISDLIVNTTGGNTGFIGYLTGTIRDLTLINGSVSDRSNPTGGLVGIVNAGGIIINCHFIGGTVTGIGTGYVGGLVGSLNNGAIYNSSASATVTSSGDRVGGLAGYMGGTLIYNSSASGNVTSTGSGLVGGLVGQQTGGTIDYSYFIGNINANTSVGGLVGSTVAIISHSYAVANITGSGNQVGGLIGFSSGAISNSYSIINGRINGSESVGTFIGRKIGGSVSNVYSIVDINSSIYGKNYVGFIGNNTGGLISYTYLIIRNNSAGNITFLELITGGTGELIGNNITISNNYVYVNASQSYLNKSANITLSGLSTSFINPRVVRDLINNCNTTTNPSCYNFTDLNAGMVRFNVSSWNGYYSIDGDISTDIQFVYPTDNHTVYINRSYILANVTAHAICTGAVSCLQNITIQLFNSSRVLINSSTINNNENFYLNFTNGTSGYASGIYYIGAYACNNLTNTCNITTNRTIYLDTITPNATLLSPTNNTLSTNVTYNFTVNLSDNILSPSVGGVANATLYIYNQTGDLYNRTTSENYDQGTANAILGIPVTLIDGIYSWFYRIIDYALNEFQSDTWNLTVDSHAPILIINYPISGGTYAPTPTLIDFNYTALDSHLDSCWYRNETMTYNISLPGCINTSIAWPEGVHTLHLWANDSLGNVSYTNVTFLITNPTVTLRNPINNSYLPYDTNILFNYTVLSSAELNNCDLWGTWNGGWHKNQTNSTAVSNVTQNNFTTINIPDGHYFWNVFCNDSIGVGKFAMDNFTLTIDTIYPTVNITSPLNATDLSTTNLWINYTYNDTNMDSCWWTNNSGAINHSITCGTNISYTAIEGINNITVYVNDSAGHINNSTIAFYLDTQGPIVNITYPINSSIFGSVPVQVNYTRFDNHLDSCWWTNNSGLTNNSLPGCINISYAASEGWNTIIVYANDTLGNVGFDDVTFLVDTTYPTLLNITYPLNITYNSLVDHIDFTAYDLTNSTCWYSNSSINSTAQACGSGNIAWTVLGIYPITGNNHWYAYVNDSFGRINYTEVYFNYNFSIIVVPTQPSAEGGSSVAGGPDVNFSAVANASQGLYNVSLYVYNDTTFTPGNLFNYSFVQYPAGTFTAPWDMIITFVRGVYYWWFEAFDVFGNVYTGNVSNLTVNVPIVTIISPPDGSTTFSNNNTQLLELVTDQLIDFCGYSLNGADNVTFYPNIEISVPYGMNTITVYCHNENGTGYHTHSFQRYDYPSLDLSITSPREGQMYKDPKQILSWQYNTSYGIVAWNYTLNGDLQPIVASGTKIEFPLTANTVRICGNATMPLPAPYYNNFTQLSECDDVSFLVTDKLTAAVTDMTLYLWASLFIVILAIFFAYIQGADSMFQFLVRVIWYSGEMLIGFTIIVEGIKVIRTLTGIAP